VPKTAEMIAGVLRRQIVDGTFAEGDPLPSESELIDRFGVSRPSVREALRILESEKLITVRRGAHGGARACRPNLTVVARYLGLLMEMDGVTLADVYTARSAIEPVAVRLLANRADRAAAVHELRGLLVAQRASYEDPDAAAAAITHFHQRLVELSGNQTLALLWGALREVLASEVLDVVVGTQLTPRRRKAREDLISRALDLIEAGEAEAARDVWLDQMTKASQIVLKLHGAKTVVDALG
jgi:DNA-binding FadR family transcriptional regulator